VSAAVCMAAKPGRFPRPGPSIMLNTLLIGSGMLGIDLVRADTVDPKPKEKKRHTNARQTARYLRQMERKCLKRKE